MFRANQVVDPGELPGTTARGGALRRAATLLLLGTQRAYSNGVALLRACIPARGS